MGPYFSPRVPHVRATGLAWAARQLLALPARRVLRRGGKHISILLFLTPVWLPSTFVIHARPAAQIHFSPLTFWSLYKWYVVVALATFLVQAFLIARLLL